MVGDKDLHDVVYCEASKHANLLIREAYTYSRSHKVRQSVEGVITGVVCAG